MDKRKIPSLSYLIDISNHPYNISEPFNKYVDYNIYNVLLEYYKNYSDIKPLEYNFYTNGKKKHHTKTLIGIDKKEDININNITVHDSIFKEYVDDEMNSLNIDIDNLPEEQCTDIVYNNKTIHIGESDFKSYISVSKLLLLELIHAYETTSDEQTYSMSKFPVRNEILKNLSDFKRPQRPRGSTSGGVIIANTNGGWKLIVGQRSEDSKINKGLISIFPNGRIKYNDFIENSFLTTVKREFKEELFNNDPQSDIFFDEYITMNHVSSGWNLRDGDLSIGYALIINSSVGYDIFKNQLESNYEVEKLVEIPIDNFDEIKNVLNLNTMSGAPIATVSESLKFIDECNLYPDLPYTIESSYNRN